MKRYEKMNKEELVKLISFNADCEICPLHTNGETCEFDGVSCDNTVRNYLNEEITPRIAKINTAEELEKTYKNFCEYCKEKICDECKYGSTTETISCFVKYLEDEEG